MSVRDRAAVAAGALTVVALVACYMPARLVATGSTKMVSYDYAAGKSVPLPDAARTLLEQLKESDGGRTPV